MTETWDVTIQLNVRKSGSPKNVRRGFDIMQQSGGSFYHFDVWVYLQTFMKPLLTY